MAEGEVKTLMDTGDASFKAGNYSEAVALYTQAIDRNSSSASIDYRLFFFFFYRTYGLYLII